MRFTAIAVTCVLACALPFVINGCKKKDTAPASSSQTGYDFVLQTKGSCMVAGDTTFFKSDQNGILLTSGVIEWDFGDGTKATGLTATHAYRDSGTYIVTMVVNGNVAGKVVKTYQLTPRLASPLTFAIGGIRTWHGHGSGFVSELGIYNESVDTEVSMQLELKVIDSNAITAGFSQRVFDLALIDSSAHTLTFYDCAGTATVTYFYAADSLVYRNVWQAPLGHGHHWETFTMSAHL